jgi:predicted nicotinamide N-methyase
MNDMTIPLRVRYQTIALGDTDIHVCTLRDKQQFSDPKGIALSLGISSASWPLFGLIWPSGLVLANHMLNYPFTGKRILEVGCGMALSSLFLNEKNADITATDYHPDVEFFLKRNIELNGGKSIAFERVDWADKTDGLGRFDLIIGSDLLYEDEHIELLANFMQNHARPSCEIIIIDPGRGRKSKLSSKMNKYGFSHEHIKPKNTEYLDKEFKGYILKFKRSS